MVDYNLERLSFLVIDDNKHMRGMVKGILRSLGVREISEAEDGSGGLKEMQHFNADVIVCDWVMDPLDGLDFTRTVRTGSDSPNPYIPIIMLTGFTEMSRVVEARDAGVTEFLAKPVSATKLYSRIKTIIGHPRNFIRIGKYFGPDRRRKSDDKFPGPDRREKEGANADDAQSTPEEAAVEG